MRKGDCTYIVAWDVHRAKVFDLCVPRYRIEHFDRLVSGVMAQPPYDTAHRVFWIMDDASIHRGASCVERFRRQWPNTRVVHTPVHASWLNQVEVYFSIVQRKVLSPNDFRDLEQLGWRLNEFESRYEKVARPFAWRYTKSRLRHTMKRLPTVDPPLAEAA